MLREPTPAESTGTEAALASLAATRLAQAALGHRELRVEAVATFGLGGSLPDSAHKFLVHDEANAPIGFVHVAPAAAPGVVAADVARLTAARDALGDELGRAVLAPIAHGTYHERTAALYPLCAPLSGGRWTWRLQRPLVRRWGIRWLRSVARRTSAAVPGSALDAAFVRPLEQLAGMEIVVPRIRDAARRAVGRLRSGWRPRRVLMHGDLWKGNIVVRRAPRTAGGRVPLAGAIAVIDWGTSEVAGYGMFDLVRFAESMALGSRALRAEVLAHCELLDCEVSDAPGHLLAALAFRALHLGHFPPPRFAAMAASCLRTLEGVL